LYASSGTQQAARAQADGAMLEEVVVTARKREESLQDSPVSITVFSDDMLDQMHIDRLDGIANATPNLMFDTGASFSGGTSAAAVYIRGIGQIDFTLNSEPAVGIYLDGVYIATSIGSVLDLAEIERVEVLRGPQGTLFGRNTIGGAINISSRMPGPEPYQELEVTLGSYDRVDVRGTVNVPISDTLSAKFSAATYNRDGFVEAPDAPGGGRLGDINRDGIRALFRFEPSDRFEAVFSADYSRQRENGVPSVLVDTFEGASLAAITARADPTSPLYLPPPAPLPPISFIDLFNLLATAPLGEQGGIAGLFPGVVPNPYFGQSTVGPDDVVDLDRDPWRNPSTIDLSSDTDIWGVMLNLAFELDWATIRSITSYRDMEAATGFNTGGVAQNIAFLRNAYDSDQFSQEIQLLGDALDDRLHWLLGFYYFEQTGLNLDDVEFTPIRILSGAKIDNESTAGFAHATYDLTDRLSITGGLRYSDETKKFVVPDTCYPLPMGPEVLFDGSVIDCARMHTIIDPKFANAGFLTFVNAPVFPAEGGRFCCLPVADADGNILALLPGLAAGDEVLPTGTFSDSFSDLTPSANLTYHWNDDLLTYVSYAEGFKSGGFVQRVFPPRTAPPSFEPETSKLYELGFKWTGFGRRARVNAALFHTDYEDLHVQVNDGIAAVTRNAAAAEVRGFELEVTVTPTPRWLIDASVGYLDGKYTSLDEDENLTTDIRVLTEDQELVNTPEWSTHLGLQYSIPFAGGAQLVSRLDWSYVSDVHKDALNFPQLHQDGYHLVDIGLTYVSARGDWEFSVFGKNVTDETYIVSGYANALTFGTAVVSLGRPDEWGLSATYHFGH
jgi:iron complex outermembrane receptor protein